MAVPVLATATANPVLPHPLGVAARASVNWKPGSTAANDTVRHRTRGSAGMEVRIISVVI